VREKQSQVLSRLFFPHWEKLYASFHKKKLLCHFQETNYLDTYRQVLHV